MWAGPQRERPTLFWLDTLCIPVEEQFREYRKKAIDSMARIYTRAASVFVLDPDLGSISYHSLEKDHASILGLIASSPWISRSWPL